LGKCGLSALAINSRIVAIFTRIVAIFNWHFSYWENSMRKMLVVICSVILAFGLAGCWGKGKAPVGKGKAPVVQTRG
jgi:ABC-type proline/glycine betaine transport system permease subunit